MNANLVGKRIQSRDDRRVLFTPKERNYIWEGLRELWNNTNVHHTKILTDIGKLMDEFNDEVE